MIRPVEASRPRYGLCSAGTSVKTDRAGAMPITPVPSLDTIGYRLPHVANSDHKNELFRFLAIELPAWLSRDADFRHRARLIRQ
jgi:hypothetical protein